MLRRYMTRAVTQVWLCRALREHYALTGGLGRRQLPVAAHLSEVVSERRSQTCKGVETDVYESAVRQRNTPLGAGLCHIVSHCNTHIVALHLIWRTATPCPHSCNLLRKGCSAADGTVAEAVKRGAPYSVSITRNAHAKQGSCPASFAAGRFYGKQIDAQTHERRSGAQAADKAAENHVPPGDRIPPWRGPAS